MAGSEEKGQICGGGLASEIPVGPSIKMVAERKIQDEKKPNEKGAWDRGLRNL